MIQTPNKIKIGKPVVSVCRPLYFTYGKCKDVWKDLGSLSSQHYGTWSWGVGAPVPSSSAISSYVLGVIIYMAEF